MSFASLSEQLPDPQELLQNINNKYLKISTYADKGTAKVYVRDRLRQTLKFSTNYSRPTSDYIFKAAVVEAFEVKGKIYEGDFAVWGNNSVGRVYSENRSYDEYKSVSMAIGKGSSASANAAAIVPLLLGLESNYAFNINRYFMLNEDIDMSVFSADNGLYLLAIIKSIRDEYSDSSTTVHLWIEKDTYFLRRYEHRYVSESLKLSTISSDSYYYDFVINEIYVDEPINSSAFKYKAKSIRRNFLKELKFMWDVLFGNGH